MDDRTRDLIQSLIIRDAGDHARPASLAVIVVHSPDAARTDALIPVDRPLTIGRRGGGADLELDDGGMSRRHAELRPRPDGSAIEIQDLGSRNGLFVDRRKTAAATARLGAVLRVGGTIFVVSSAPRQEPRQRPAGVVGRSALLLELLWTCESYAPSDLPVLLLGDTGTGKEVFAAAIHELSGRTGPCVTLNCAAIPRELGESLLFGHLRGAFTGATSAQRGAFAQAQGGTLFLDEIGELSPDVQAKLLRALENRDYTPIGSTTAHKSDARVVSATNVDLRRAADAGGFRRDLYARLAGGVIRLPPLRQRREDIPSLARHFLRQLSEDDLVPWSSNFAEILVTHGWPMNARELRLTMQRLLLRTRGQTKLGGSDLLAVIDLGDAVDQPASAGPVDDEADSEAPERDDLVALLREHRGNVAAVAKHFNRDRKQVYRWLRRHGLRAEDYR